MSLVGVAQNFKFVLPTGMDPDVIFISSLPDHMQVSILLASARAQVNPSASRQGASTQKLPYVY
jgi:hypothetical protein